jgi:heat shock protein HslJ
MKTHTPLIRLLVPILMLVAVAACGGSSSSSAAPSAPVAGPATLAGTSWLVKSVDGQTSVVGKEPSVAFDETTVSGSGGCNTYTGEYTYDAATATLTPGTLASTRMACAGREGTFETEFLVAFEGPLTVSVAGDDMTLAGGGHTIVLTKAP